ncbi:DNA polymerase epsilon subunit C [Spathaspora sp. JA1]|nr:DNA polymerase epsilon subunit C [Spathaspora sp. JA1]
MTSNEISASRQSTISPENTPETSVPLEKSSTPAVEAMETDDPEETTQTPAVEGENEPTSIAEGEQQADDGTEPSLSLPLAKIKRIFKMDPEYFAASQSAVYTAGLATELFVQYFVEQASLLAKMDKRKKIQYKDFSTAVSSHDSLNFLSDTIPKTQPIGELIQNKKVNIPGSAGASKDSNSTENDNDVPSGTKDILSKGQQTLHFPVTNAPKENPPIRKAVIHDLIVEDEEATATDDGEGQEDVIMID